MPEFCSFPHNSSLYLSSLELRNRILREPLGLTLSDVDVALEELDHHFGLTDAGVLIASVILRPISSEYMKLRQMVVDPAYQGKGIGRELLSHVETWCQTQQVKRIDMHARLSAEEFYNALGYSRTSDVFSEVGLPHVKMGKTISPSS